MRLLICVPLLLAACIGNSDAPPLQEVGRLQHPELDEASGLARSGRATDLFWAINDDGPPVLYALGRQGANRGRVTVSGASNIDWEDLAEFSVDGKSYLVIADIGDNEARREYVRLYVVAEPSPQERRVAIEWTVDFRYPGGPRDAEALAVDAVGERIYVLSKRDVPALLYALPLKPGSNDVVVATRVAALDNLPQPSARERSEAARSGWAWQPTAMDFAADGSSALILTYGGVYFFSRDRILDWPAALGATALGLRLGNITNAEAIAIDADGNAAFLTVEKQHAPLLRIDLASARLWQENNTPVPR